MQRRTILLLALALPLAAQASRTIILIRHAERASSATDSELSEAGKKRAKLLAMMLRDVKIDSILTSEFLRTKQTAAPLAAAKGLTAVAVTNTSDIVKRLKGLPPGATAVVVNHSNTVPEIVSSLGASTPAIDDAEFDRMLILRWSPPGSPELLTLRYGPK